ncbi:hypothetical protein [Flavobacterium sp. 3-210]
MKFLIPIVIIVLTNISLDCDNFKTGKFETPSKFGGKVIIERTKQFHTETLTRNGNIIRYKIKWLNDCSFLLYDRKLLKGNEEIKDPKIIEQFAKDTIFNEIIEINDSEYRTKSKINNFEKWFESTSTKIK